MKFEQTMDLVKNTVDKALEKFFFKKEEDCIDQEVLVLVRQIAGFTLRGGKRMRPLVCWMGQQTMPSFQFQMTNEIPKKFLSTMMGLELFQTFALIHDDILDEDVRRRGKPTVHECFKKYYIAAGPAAGFFGSPSARVTRRASHFGESMAILAGDLALVWADELISRPGLELRTLQIYQKMKEEVIYGQILDIAKNQAGLAIDLVRINALKSAYYSVVRPAQIGAALNGAKKDHLVKLELFGLPAGQLFQLRDDLLDGALSSLAFEREYQRLMLEATHALNNLNLDDEHHKLFLDFLKFVSTRSA